MLNRRIFLGAVAATLLPLRTLTKGATIAPHNPLAGKAWLLTIDTKDKIISYTGPKISLQQLYSMLQDEWCEPDMMPYPVAMTAITPHAFKMENNWVISEDSTENLTDGTLTQGEEVYASSIQIGNK
jgi:hypothetical protein